MLPSKGRICLHALVILSICMKFISSCGVHVCLTWEAKTNNITFKCKVSNLLWQVNFFNHEHQNQGYCLSPIPVPKCFSSHNVISQDLRTNTTVLVIQRHVDNRLNGPWKCYHGTNKDSAIVNVTVLKKETIKTICKNDNYDEQYMAWTFIGVMVGVFIVFSKRIFIKISKWTLPSRCCTRDYLYRRCFICDTKCVYVTKLVIGISLIICVIIIPAVVGQEDGSGYNKEYFIIFGVCMVFIFVICLIIPEKDEEKKQPVDRETDSNQSSLTDEIEKPVDCEESRSQQLLSNPNEPPLNCKEPSRQQISSGHNEPPAEFEEPSRQQLLSKENVETADEIEIPVDCEEPSSHQLLSDPNEPPTTYEEPRRQQLLNVEVHQPTDLEAETKQNNF